MNAVPLADENEIDALFNQCRAVGADRDDVLKVSNPPALREERSGEMIMKARE